MIGRSEKSGIFFTADAFMAISVVVVGVVLIFSLRVDQVPPEQTTLLSGDIINLISSTELYELNNDYLFTLREEGNITNIRHTLAEQAGEFFYLNKTSLARKMIDNVTGASIPEQYDFSLLIEDQLIYRSADTENGSDVLISSKKIIMGIYNTSKYWGPYNVEVRVWR